MEFTSKLEGRKEIDINGIKEYLGLDSDIDVDYNPTARIYWTLEIDARGYGVKDFSIIIQKVALDIEIEYYEDEDGAESEKIYKDITLEIDNHKLIKCEMKVTDSCLYPCNLEVNMGKKIVEVVVS